MLANLGLSLRDLKAKIFLFNSLNIMSNPISGSTLQEAAEEYSVKALFSMQYHQHLEFFVPFTSSPNTSYFFSLLHLLFDNSYCKDRSRCKDRGEGWVRSCLGQSDNAMVEFSILGEVRKGGSRTAILEFQRLDFELFRTLIGRDSILKGRDLGCLHIHTT